MQDIVFIFSGIMAATSVGGIAMILFMIATEQIKI
jgi:hypothetical protein